MKVCPVCRRQAGGEEPRCPIDGAAWVHVEPAGPSDPLIGQVVDGRYRVERLVGRGGMGAVYAARHVVVGRTVALKVLKATLDRNEETLTRFVREAQSANAVRSRHILRAEDFGQLPDGALYVVMELLEGESLGAALRARSLGRADLLALFAQIADGLGAAHAAGVVHRDLKPDNVFLVTEPGGPREIKILDFGVAKVMTAEAQGLTETGVVLGTPHYMAPEQARGENVDHRVDIYALGVMMYLAFTGRLPFVADSAVGVLAAHIVEEPEPPSRSGVDAVLEEIILRCMRKHRDQRFSSMAEVAAQLRRLAGLPHASPVAFAGQPSPLGDFPTFTTDPSLRAMAQPNDHATGPHMAGSHTVTGLTRPANQATSPGLYLALGAGIATVGVAAAVALFALRRPAADAEAAQPPTNAAEAASTSATSGSSDPVPAPSTAAAPEPAPGPEASAIATATAATPPPPNPTTLGGPRPPATASPTAPPASPPETATAVPAPPPPRPGGRPEIRSPFD